MTNFAKMANLAKSYQRFDKEMTQRGILTNGDYNKHGKLGYSSFKVCQNSRRHVDNCEFYENAKFGKNL